MGDSFLLAPGRGDRALGAVPSVIEQCYNDVPHDFRHPTPSANAERRRRAGAARRAAAEVLTAEGPSALSVRRVAADAGCLADGRLLPLRRQARPRRGPVPRRLPPPRGGPHRPPDGRPDRRSAGVLSRRTRRFALDSPAAYSVMFARSGTRLRAIPPCRADAGCAFEAVVDLVRVALDAARSGRATRSTSPRASGRPATAS